jgi:hypothetical protein
MLSEINVRKVFLRNSGEVSGSAEHFDALPETGSGIGYREVVSELMKRHVVTTCGRLEA